MSNAAVSFDKLNELGAEPGQEQQFNFNCPKHKGRRCEGLILAGRTKLHRDPQGANGGVAQWDWDGDRENPTFSPSINCKACWHGYIRKGRCVSTSNTDEPEPA
jgi:hypothetical protein